MNAETLLGDTSITNPGEVLSWPTWTITRPCTQLTLTDLGTGDAFTVDEAIPVGKTLTIITQPGMTDVALSDGTDWWPELSGTPQFWPIRSGETNIGLTLVGSGAGSSVVVSFTARYKSAW